MTEAEVLAWAEKETERRGREEDDGRNTLLGPPEAFSGEYASAEIQACCPPHLGPGRTDRERLGTRAAEALEDHRYRSLRIEVTTAELKIVKAIGRGTLPTEVYALDAAKRALVASGIEAHFDNNGPFLGSRLQRAVGVMAKRGRTGVLYDSADRRTTDYVLRPEQHFDPDPS